MRQAVLGHNGEALPERNAFQKLAPHEKDALIEFLKTLQVLPPGTKDLVVDENYQAREWPPIQSAQKAPMQENQEKKLDKPGANTSN